MHNQTQPLEAANKAQSVLDRLRKAKSSRLNWESYWEECAEYAQPNFSNTFMTDGYSISQAQKKDRKRVDGTAEIALFRCAAVMESLLTPRNTLWHNLTTNDKDLNKIPSVRNWFDDTRDRLFKYRYASQANFASQCHEHYMALGLNGTGCMFIDKLSPKGFRYSQIHVAQIYFYENHQGVIDEAIRPFKLTARNALQRWPKGLPEDIVKAAAERPHDLFNFIHSVYPRSDIDYDRKDFKGMAFESCYVAEQGNWLVEEGGYHTFPYAISRYVTAPGELYGRSPTMQALTNIKVLNQQKITILKQGHRIVDPVLLAYDDGVLDSFSLKPGAINPGAMSGEGKRLVDVLPTGNLAVGEKMMQMEKDEINAAFMTDLFQIFMDRPQMTATEVMELAREKGILFSPTMGRQETEFLGPMIEREMDLAMQQGLLLPMPPELIAAGGDYKVIFDSPLSRAQRSEQAAGIMRTISWASQIASETQSPAPLDHFDFDVIIPELSDIQGVPAAWMKTPDKIDAMRKARDQEQQTKNVIQAGPTIAALTKNQQA